MTLAEAIATAQALRSGRATADKTLETLERAHDMLANWPAYTTERSWLRGAIVVARSDLQRRMGYSTHRTEALPSTKRSEVQSKGYLSRGTDADHYPILDGAPVGRFATEAELLREYRAMRATAPKRTLPSRAEKRLERKLQRAKR